MSRPALSITAYFDFPFTAEAFTLNDPVRGELDGTDYRLYSATPVELADDGTYLTIRRGSDASLFPDAEAGSGVLSLLNMDRTYDPVHTSSPYFGNITPGKRLTVQSAGVTIFDGRIEDYDLSYDTNRVSTVTAKFADGLATLARQEFDDWTATASQTAGERLGDVLDRLEVQWPYARDLDDGVSTLQGDTVSWGTNVLDYCKTVAKSDVGLLFVSRDGVLTFRDRHAGLNDGAEVVFADDGSGIKFQRIETSYGSELLFNRVGAQRAGGASQTVIDLDAQLSYGVRSYTLPTLLLEDDGQVLDLANFVLGQYADPQYRVAELEIELARLGVDEQAQVLSLDIASIVRVLFTPNGVGDQVDRYCVVYGIEHTISPALHTVRLFLGDVAQRFAFQLDDTVFGRLDANSLAF